MRIEMRLRCSILSFSNWQFVIGNGKWAIGNNCLLELGNRQLVI